MDHVSCDVIGAEHAPSVSVRFLEHELRTPINHIIGYSEMPLDDLTDRASSAEHHAVEATHAIGMELLALVNATLESTVDPDAVASREVLVTLRAGVQRLVDDIRVECLCTGSLADAQSSADVLKIISAASRLAEFAQTGQTRSSETEPRGV